MIDLAAVVERAKSLAASLAGYRRGRAAVVDWRLNYAEARRASLGIHDSLLGSVYSPFQVRDEASGSLLVAWSGGEVSRATFDGNTGGDLGLILDRAYRTRHRDDDSKFFAGRCRYPPVPIYDPAVARIADGKFALLYDLVDHILAAGRAAGVGKISGAARASVGATVVRTSRGLGYAAQSTQFSYSFSYDNEIGDWRTGRRPLRVRQVEPVVRRALELLPMLRRQGQATSGACAVLIGPRFLEELVDHYLIGNLSGAEVANGQSAFSAADFTSRRPVLRADLSLGVDPSVPFSAGSYHVTSEGLPARRESYIERGRLRRPIVGVKYGRRLGIQPTTPPTSTESVVLTGAGSLLSERRALARLDGGLCVLSALGLHTQDAASGLLSLTAPRALVVRDGVTVGSVKATLATDFFALLNDPETALVKVAGQRFPGLLGRFDVTVG